MFNINKTVLNHKCSMLKFCIYDFFMVSDIVAASKIANNNLFSSIKDNITP